MTPAGRRGQRRGWTLIEALVAVALTVVLAAIVLSTSLTVHRVMKGRTVRHVRAAEAATALRRLAGDLEAAFEPSGDRPLELASGEKAAVTADLHFFAFPAAAPGMDGAGPDLYELRYQVRRMDDDAQSLVRIDRCAAGPGAMGSGTTNTLIGRAVSISMEVSDGTNWTAAWPLPGGPALPRSARASVAYAGAAGLATARVETVIQAGVPVSPRIERRLAPAAGR